MVSRLRTWLWHVKQDIGRSGNLRTFRRLRESHTFTSDDGYPIDTVNIRLRGQRLQIRVRLGTYDIGLVKSILTEASEYRVPIPLHPTVIVDAGANIGVTALYYAVVYPEARIFCFEPLPENVELLRQNTEPFRDRITIIPKGLSDHEGNVAFHAADNTNDFSAGGFGDWGNRAVVLGTFSIVPFTAAMSAYGISSVDLMKLDIEGSEWSALRGMPEDLIANISVIVGELHGTHDFDVIGLLSKTHKVGYKKNYWNDRATSFIAVNRTLATADAPS
jgi:FkbM family methyltransferase